MDSNLKDRIGKYLIPGLEEYIFDELSEGYLSRTDMKDLLSGVPVPIKKSELAELTNLKIALGMATVLGSDVNFKYGDNYIRYIDRTFGEDFQRMLIARGVEKAAQGEYRDAVILFRSVIRMNPDSRDAVYCYGRACKDAYENSEDEEFIGRFKAESLEAFEKLVQLAPDFHMGYYFLGYGYLNLGLYTKADLAFKKFLELTEGGGIGEIDGINGTDREDEADIDGGIDSSEGYNIPNMRSEIEDWGKKLKDPVKIEGGYNMILSGKYHEGIEELEPYTDNPNFNTWWPLWYYLGIAYRALGEYDAAIINQQEVLKLSPSNQDAMKELEELYEALGDSQSAGKYREKIKIVERNREADLKDKEKERKNYS